MSEQKNLLRSRKRDVVSAAILDSAIALFETKGFDETEVAEIAEAAGISKRTFFRYFATKDDLLARSVMEYGAVLDHAIRSAPPKCNDLEVIHQTLLAGVRYNKEPEARAQKLIAICADHPSARQAYLSRRHLVEDAMADAFAARARRGGRNDLRMRLLAGITLTLMNATLAAWFLGEAKTLDAALVQAEAELRALTHSGTG